MRRLFRAVLIIIAAAFLFVPALVSAQEQPMKVRVGFAQFTGFSYADKMGERHGYGYDFLRMAAPYANLKYEYISDKTYSELVEMLERGEIDLLAPMHRKPDREGMFLFSHNSIGSSSIVITTLDNNVKYSAGRPATFDGITLGLFRSSSLEGAIAALSQRESFAYSMKYYDSEDKLYRALWTGEVDGLATRDLRPIRDGEMILYRFDDDPIYIAGNRNNGQLMERIDRAISRMDIDNPKWREDLYYRHYAASGDKMGFGLSMEERVYMSRARDERPLKILLNPDTKPYSFIEDGKRQGIFFDIFQDAATRYALKYEVMKVKDTEEFLSLCRQGAADIIVDFPSSTHIAEQSGYNTTEPYFSGLMATVYRQNTKNIKTVAVKRGALGMATGYGKLYEDKNIIEYSTMDECVEAVKSGNADATYMFTYSAAYYVSKDYTNRISYEPIRGTLTDFRMAVRNDADPALFSLMNKYAISVTDTTIIGLVNRYRQNDDESFILHIYQNPVKFLLVVLTVTILAAAAIIGYTNHKREKTQRMKLEEAYREAREASEEATRANKAKSEFLANMSHDIRTPMNAIVGMTRIAMKNLDDRQRVEDCLTKIDISSGHLLSLINDVLDMSKLETGSVIIPSESVDLNEVLDDCLTMITPQAREMNVSIIANEDQRPKHHYVLSSNLHLKQIFINLASNGVKYNRHGGTLEFFYRETMIDDDTVEFLFCVRDTGVGMTKEFMQNMFKPFSQEEAGSRTNYRGTGLGLSIVKIIVDNMGGTIAVDSTKDVGSTFKVSLPLKIDKEKERMAKQEEELAKIKVDISGTRVLLVEDNELNREITRFILEDEEAAVDEAEDGSIAVEKLKAGNEYDVILMDIMMPVMDGYQATAAIRESEGAAYQNIPIIAMTANAFAEDARRCIEAGMNAHIPKPVEPEKLTQTIRRVIDEVKG